MFSTNCQSTVNLAAVMRLHCFSKRRRSFLSNDCTDLSVIKKVCNLMMGQLHTSGNWSNSIKVVRRYKFCSVFCSVFPVILVNAKSVNERKRGKRNPKCAAEQIELPKSSNTVCVCVEIKLSFRKPLAPLQMIII